MDKIIGVQAEVNITMHSDIIKGLGKGIEKGAIHVEDILKGLKQPLIDALKKVITK
jgi:hypothetical protein